MIIFLFFLFGGGCSIGRVRIRQPTKSVHSNETLTLMCIQYSNRIEVNQSALSLIWYLGYSWNKIRKLSWNIDQRSKADTRMKQYKHFQIAFCHTYSRSKAAKYSIIFCSQTNFWVISFVFNIFFRKSNILQGMNALSITPPSKF